jgi:hypothetical protein
MRHAVDTRVVAVDLCHDAFLDPIRAATAGLAIACWSTAPASAAPARC